MDGLTLAKEIRKQPGYARTPILFFGSMMEEGLKAQLSMLAPSAVIPKPIRLTRFQRQLEELLAPRHEPTASTPQPLFDATLGQQHPLRLLVVEDNVVNRKLAVRMLEKLGYQPDTASDGIEGVEAILGAVACEKPYDLVLMDLHLPGKDGLEAVREVRQALEPSQCPRFVALTAGVLEEERRAAFAAGMDGYLSKPFTVNDLVSILQTTLPLAQRHRAKSTGELIS
jgi:CheY-like chemotaxis protein